MISLFSDRIPWLEFIRVLVWCLTGVTLALFIAGSARYSFSIFGELHPVPKMAVYTSGQHSENQQAMDRPVNELFLVKSNKEERNKKNDESSSNDKNTLEKVNVDSVEKLEESSLPLEVVGITFGPVGFRSVSLRNLKERTVKSLSSGEEWTGATVKEIRRGEVLIKNNRSDEMEILPLERDYKLLSQGEEDKESQNKTTEVSRYKVNQAIQSNMNKLLKSVEVSPAFDAGQVIGLKMQNFKGRPGTLLRNLGFKSGDVITRVNGQKIDGIDQAMTLWSSLRHQKNFDVNVLRNGDKKSFEYELTR